MSKLRTRPERKPGHAQSGDGCVCMFVSVCVSAHTSVHVCACVQASSGVHAKYCAALGCVCEKIFCFVFCFFVEFFSHNTAFIIHCAGSQSCRRRAGHCLRDWPNLIDSNEIHPLLSEIHFTFPHRGSRLPRKKKSPSFYDFWFLSQKRWECNATLLCFCTPPLIILPLSERHTPSCKSVNHNLE